MGTDGQSCGGGVTEGGDRQPTRRVRSEKLIDSVFDEFSSLLGDGLREAAEELPELLEMAPAGTAWSSIYAHPLPLAAPACVADPRKSLPEPIVREAVKAHMMAVIEAVVRERREIGAIKMTRRLEDLLVQFRLYRDRAAANIPGNGGAPSAAFDFALQHLEQVLSLEAQLHEDQGPANLAVYERFAAGKHAPWLPASDLLAQACGWPRARRLQLRELIVAVGVGWRAYADVVEWEAAETHGVSWAVLLARGLSANKGDGGKATLGSSVRREVLESGALVLLLQRAHHHLKAAAKLAKGLEIEELAQWAATQAAAFGELRRAEREYPGYAVRAKALRAWLHEVVT